jgi:hypothetical protein
MFLSSLQVVESESGQPDRGKRRDKITGAQESTRNSTGHEQQEYGAETDVHEFSTPPEIPRLLNKMVAKFQTPRPDGEFTRHYNFALDFGKRKTLAGPTKMKGVRA